MSVFWPTHVGKARQRKNAKLSQKKRARKLRRLHADGKRGELNG